MPRKRSADGLERKVAALEGELESSRRYSQAIEQLLIANASKLGAPFFESTVIDLADYLQADVVFIGELAGGGTRLETVALCVDGIVQDNTAYDLGQTPGEMVLNSGVRSFPSGVADRFPDDPFLRQTGAEAFIGVPLNGHDNLPLGMLAVLFRSPVEAPHEAESILQIVALRAAGEIQRKQAETALKESEARYRLLIENQTDLVVKVDPQGRFLFVSPSYCKMFGKDETQLIGRHFMPLVHEEDRAATAKAMERLHHPPFTAYIEQRALTARGWRWLAWVDTAILDAGNEISAIIGVGRDITDQKNAERALRNNLHFMDTLLDTIPSPVYYKDAAGVFLGCNKAFATDIIGLAKDSIVGRSVFDLTEAIPEDLATLYHQQDLGLIENPGSQFYEAEVRCADGVRRDFYFHKAVYTDSIGHAAGIVGLMLDITDLKRTKSELVESKGLFDAFMDHLPALAFIKNLAGEYIYLNRACRDYYGQEPSQRIGKTDRELWSETTARQIVANDRMVMENDEVFMGTEIVDKEEGRQHHLTTKFPIYKKGAPAALGGIALDITDNVRADRDRTKLKMQLIQAQKMEAIGQLAGGIAHDFNNILSAILGFGELAQMEVEQESPTGKYIEGILKAGNRARDLVQQILFISRQEEQTKHPVLISTVMKEAVKLLRASLPTSIEIHTRFAPDLKMVNADPTQIHQVIMNLGTNAGHALGRTGGTFTITLDNVYLDHESAEERGCGHAGWYVKLEVRDDGVGIPRETLTRIFEPYFTTKEKHEGTGLGLAVVHGIVETHDGKVAVNSTPGQGAAFEILLPAIEDTAETRIQSDSQLVRGSERVLLVDDEIAITEVGTKMLSGLGYQVVAMTKSAEALAYFRSHAAEIDVVITDMTMPEISGDQLSVQLLDIRPDIPIVLCSGYSDHISEAGARGLGIRAYLKKPVQISQLAKTLREVLDAPATAGGRVV